MGSRTSVAGAWALALALGAGAALGCSAPPGGCQGDRDCPGGNVCVARACQIAPALAIVAPGDGLAARGTVEVRVEVRAADGGDLAAASLPEELELLLGEEILVRLEPPYVYAWSTDSVAERVHQLRARVWRGTLEFASLPVRVEVDRTPPEAPAAEAPSLTRQRSAAIAGTAEPGADVLVRLGTGVIGRALADPAGSFALTLDLVEGPNLLLVSARDRVGNESLATAVAVTADWTPPPAPAVAAESPASQALVPVQGTAEPGARIRVLVGAVQHAEATAAPAGGWSAEVALPEGRSEITVTATDAAGNVSPPSVVAVTVDRTPPRVVARVPARDAANVWSRDPIAVTFSEPMMRSSVTGAAVLLAGSGGAPVAAELALSEDGRTLVVRPVSLPAVPNTLTATLTRALADLAGNPLAASDSWSWHLPAWQELGPDQTTAPSAGAVRSALAVDGTGDPTVASVVVGASAGPVSVRQWQAGWTSLPAPQAAGTTVAVDVDPQGLPALAWVRETGTPLHAWAATWGGSAWVGLVDLTPSATPASRPLVCRDGAGGAVAAWVEGSGATSRLVARRWNGVAWGAASAVATNATAISNLSMSLAPGGNPRLVWEQGTSLLARTWLLASETWSARTWPIARVSSAVAVDPAEEHPVRAWLDGASLRVERWACLASPCTADVRNWRALGGALNVAGQAAATPALALDPDGVPVVAWVEGGAVYVKRWNGTAWEQLGGNVDGIAGTTASAPRIAVGPSGVVAVSLQATSATSVTLAVRRYNR